MSNKTLTYFFIFLLLSTPYFFISESHSVTDNPIWNQNIIYGLCVTLAAASAGICDIFSSLDEENKKISGENHVKCAELLRKVRDGTKLSNEDIEHLIEIKTFAKNQLPKDTGLPIKFL